jgi:PTS system galactitol-specific IIA component
LLLEIQQLLIIWLIQAEALEVKFLFLILNNDPDMHSTILAKIMDFLAGTSVDDLNELFNSDSNEEIYDFLENNFEIEK